MAKIICEVEPTEVGAWTLLVLPKAASDQLPSRGMCMIEGTVDGEPFQAALEPDGHGSHWMSWDKLEHEADASGGKESLALAFEVLEEWPEPTLPSDLKEALAADPEAFEQWQDTTTKARWDWIRWIRSTPRAATRQSRIEKARSMLTSGKRRPCCFDRSRCTEPEVSSNGKLRLP